MTLISFRDSYERTCYVRSDQFSVAKKPASYEAGDWYEIVFGSETFYVTEKEFDRVIEIILQEMECR